MHVFYTRKGEKASVRRGIWDEDTNVEVYPTHTAGTVEVHADTFCASTLYYTDQGLVTYLDGC